MPKHDCPPSPVQPMACTHTAPSPNRVWVLLPLVHMKFMFRPHDCNFDCFVSFWSLLFRCGLVTFVELLLMRGGNCQVIMLHALKKMFLDVAGEEGGIQLWLCPICEIILELICNQPHCDGAHIFQPCQSPGSVLCLWKAHSSPATRTLWTKFAWAWYGQCECAQRCCYQLWVGRVTLYNMLTMLSGVWL